MSKSKKKGNETKKAIGEKKEQLNALIESYKGFEGGIYSDVESIAFIANHCDMFSSRNFVLINGQKRGAACVGSFGFWKKKGYVVNKGEKGIQILVPAPFTVLDVDGESKPLNLATKEERAAFKSGEIEGRTIMGYKVGYVFDISQTNCPTENYPKAFCLGEDDPGLAPIIEGLIRYVEEVMLYNVDVNSDHGVLLRGTCDNYNDKLTVNKLYKGLALISTLSHEIGHGILKHGVEGRLSAAQKEVEADIFSIALMSMLGVDIIDSRKTHFAHHGEIYQSEQGLSTKDDKKESTAFERAYKGLKDNLSVLEQYISFPKFEVVPCKVDEAA